MNYDPRLNVWGIPPRDSSSSFHLHQRHRLEEEEGERHTDTSFSFFFIDFIQVTCPERARTAVNGRQAASNPEKPDIPQAPFECCIAAGCSPAIQQYFLP